jgi:hypothetical protein
MIIKERQDWKHYLEKISKQNNHAFSVSKRGTLIVNGRIESYNFLAYQNGCWYGAKGNARGASEKIEKEKYLFAISEKNCWMIRSDGNVEYYSSTKPLSEDAVTFLFAEHSPGICLYAVDGSRQESPMVTSIDPAPYSSDMAAMIIIALVRQHDPESADQMEKFWFKKDEDSHVVDDGDDSLWCD